MKPFGETLVGGVYAAVPSAQNSRAKGEDLMRREGDPAQIDAPCHRRGPTAPCSGQTRWRWKWPSSEWSSVLAPRIPQDAFGARDASISVSRRVTSRRRKRSPPAIAPPIAPDTRAMTVRPFHSGGAPGSFRLRWALAPHVAEFFLPPGRCA